MYTWEAFGTSNISKHERPVFLEIQEFLEFQINWLKLIEINRNDETKTFQVCKQINKQFIGSYDCHDRTVLRFFKDLTVNIFDFNQF